MFCLHTRVLQPHLACMEKGHLLPFGAEPKAESKVMGVSPPTHPPTKGLESGHRRTSALCLALHSPGSYLAGLQALEPSLPAASGEQGVSLPLGRGSE